MRIIIEDFTFSNRQFSMGNIYLLSLFFGCPNKDRFYFSVDDLRGEENCVPGQVRWAESPPEGCPVVVVSRWL